MIQVNATQIKEKIQSKETFILDFYADWCGPCKMMMRNIEMAENLLKEGNTRQVPIYKLDIEANRDFAMEMGIRSIPTLKVFKEGEMIKTNTGVLQANQFIQLNEELMS
jgi:thioredoxin 1